jgi:membrane-bound lytic murein transglycosylase B
VSVRAAPRTILIVAAVVVVLGLVATAVLVFLAPRLPALPGADPTAESPGPSWAPPASPPVATGAPGKYLARQADADWLAETAAATGIPERALAAYAGAAIWKGNVAPECGIGWNTLAAVGAVESDHGRFGGSSVASDGLVTPPIYGVALDGGDTEHIPDSDDGELDGDADYDRAVGPFQLIPQTWRNWHADGNGDGIHDPHHIDDAARAAVNYLCRVSIDIDTEAGWRAAISGYNSDPDYIAAVAVNAVRYADATSAG